jgi:hypothetical protein
MSAADESENLLDHLPERINPNGWRLISKVAFYERGCQEKPSHAGR